MGRTIWGLLLVVPLAFASLSGCVDCSSGPPVTARGITTGDASAGLRGFSLDILVVDGPGGSPVEGAGVVVYYGGQDASEWSGPRVEVGPDRVLVEPMNATSTPDSREVLRMMTGPDGVAHARVPGNRIVGVVAAKDGFTEEWIPALAAGDTGTDGSITVPLYRAAVLVEMEAVWGPGAASTGAATSSQYAWDPQPVAFAETEDANRGYAARIVEMEATLTWTNGPTTMGDLGIGIGPPDDTPRYFADSGNNVATGAQTETTVLGIDTLRDHGILGAPGIHAGASTKSGFVAPFGMPYALAIEARFDTARAALASCLGGNGSDDSAGAGASVPGGGTIGAILALAGAALVAGATASRRSR